MVDHVFDEAVVTVGWKPVLCAASDSGPKVFPPQDRLGAVLPVHRLGEAELAARLRRVVALEAELAAYKTDLVLALAGRRPDALDMPAGHHARGWNFALDPDGTLHVTTPTGVTRTTRLAAAHPTTTTGPRRRPATLLSGGGAFRAGQAPRGGRSAVEAGPATNTQVDHVAPGETEGTQTGLPGPGVHREPKGRNPP